jgi:hypothetical protein
LPAVIRSITLKLLPRFTAFLPMRETITAALKAATKAQDSHGAFRLSMP